MFSITPEQYDLLYRSLKDYETEARELAELLRAHDSGIRTVLDVACGTGEHARVLSTRHAIHVDGLDILPAFVAAAQRKNPAGKFVVADMTEFHLEETYDAVVCLFSSIGYARTLKTLARTLTQFAKHVRPHGVVVIEPWLSPDDFEVGRIDIATAENEDTKLCRLSHTSRAGRCSIVRLEYLSATVDGIQHVSESHELALVTRQEMLDAFNEADLEAEYRDPGFCGRGLYVAHPAA
jgi:SAM-dependent methyltransferase